MLSPCRLRAFPCNVSLISFRTSNSFLLPSVSVSLSYHLSTSSTEDLLCLRWAMQSASTLPQTRSLLKLVLGTRCLAC